MVPNRRQKISEEIRRLIEVQFIRPIKYPISGSNIVVVQKRNGQIRVYIDFTKLNKACPNYQCPPPRITNLVQHQAFKDSCFWMRFLGTIIFRSIDQIRNTQHSPLIMDNNVTSFYLWFKKYRSYLSEVCNIGCFLISLGKKFVYIDDMVVRTTENNNNAQDIQHTF